MTFWAFTDASSGSRLESGSSLSSHWRIALLLECGTRYHSGHQLTPPRADTQQTAHGAATRANPHCGHQPLSSNSASPLRNATLNTPPGRAPPQPPSFPVHLHRRQELSVRTSLAWRPAATGPPCARRGATRLCRRRRAPRGARTAAEARSGTAAGGPRAATELRRLRGGPGRGGARTGREA